jgi:N-acetylneuraminic acid mutarotase
MKNYYLILFAFTCFFACKKGQDIPSPQIINISPNQGPVKSFVIITGLHFDSVATGVTVKFNGVQATIAYINDSSITVIVPDNASTGKITITVNGRMVTSAEDFVILDLAGTWVQKADISNFGTEYCCGAGFNIGNYGYVSLGFNGGAGMNELLRYDPGSNTWAQMANAPISRYFPNWFVIDDIVYVGLGELAYQDSAVKNIYAYDPNTNLWSQKNSFPGNAQVGAVNFVIGNKGYFVGGQALNGDYSPALWEYDANSDSWTQKNNFPGPNLVQAVAFTLDSVAYVCGWEGYNNQNGQCWQYNPVTDSWTQKNSFPGTESYLPTALTINNRAYIMGGDNWQYDQASDTWTRMAFFTFYRNGGYSFTINNTGYFVAGVGNYDFDCYACSDLWQFTPPN